METKSIWSIRTALGLMVVEYKVLNEESDSYIIQDTSCKGHDNCIIRISKDFKYIEAVNDSAKEYESFHNESRYFGSENEAKSVFYNEVLDRYKESLNEAQNKVDNIEKFLNYTKSKRYNKTSGVSYGSDIFTFNKDTREIELEIIMNQFDDYNALLDKYIFEYKINSFKHIHSILNGKETEEKHYYVDMRKNEGDMSAVYIEVLGKDDKLKIEAQSESCYEWGDYDHNYYAGEKFEDGATTRNNCRYLIIQSMKSGLEYRLSDYKSSVKKYKEKINEYELKLNSLK
jgi:hypothetical protein